MKQSSPRIVLLLLLASTAAAAAQAPGPPPRPLSNTQRFTPNWQNVDISVVAEVVGNATGTTFILDPRVRAQVTLTNAKAMTATELNYAFLSLLQVYNFAAVRSGDVVKIVPDSSVRTMPGNDLPANMKMGDDEIVTTVLEARNIGVNQLATALRPLIPQYGQILPIPGTNKMVITDRASNVARIQRILQRVDQSSGAEVDVIPLQNSSASDLVRSINALNAGAADPAGGPPVRVVADDRSNSILVSGEPSQRLRIAMLVASLDTPVDDNGGTAVRRLKYADAEKLGPKLKEQMTGVAAAAGPAAAGAVAADRSVTIWPYKETNALVITAPPKQMRQLMLIVDSLDIPREQVLIEAIVADVTTDKSADLGVNWAVFSNEEGTNVPAGGFISPVGTANGNPVNIVDLTKSILSPGTATTAPLGATFAIGRLRDNGINFAGMIRALRADANTNVLATPSITASDNQEAELKSAQEVPFITGQYTNTGGAGGAVNPFTTVQRSEVGTILKITPQINGGNTMTLTISLESSELAGQSGDAGSAITNKRSFKTTVLVENGMTVVVGGLIRDSKISGETRVPFLGRIPLLGELFKTRNGKRTQSNLMVFIRPKIITDSYQAQLESNTKYNLIRDAQRLQNNQKELIPLIPFDVPPTLPPAPIPVAPPVTPTAPPATTQPVADPTKP